MLAGRLAQARADVQRRVREFDTLFRLTPVGIGIANDPRMPGHLGQPGLRRDASHRARRANASLSAPASERPRFIIEKHGVPVAAGDLPLQVAARLGAEVKNVELDVDASPMARG